jgi:hypothetical protein
MGWEPVSSPDQRPWNENTRLTTQEEIDRAEVRVARIAVLHFLEILRIASSWNDVIYRRRIGVVNHIIVMTYVTSEGNELNFEISGRQPNLTYLRCLDVQLFENSPLAGIIIPGLPWPT